MSCRGGRPPVSPLLGSRPPRQFFLADLDLKPAHIRQGLRTLRQWRLSRSGEIHRQVSFEAEDEPMSFLELALMLGRQYQRPLAFSGYGLYMVLALGREGLTAADFELARTLDEALVAAQEEAQE